MGRGTEEWGSTTERLSGLQFRDLCSYIPTIIQVASSFLVSAIETSSIDSTRLEIARCPFFEVCRKVDRKPTSQKQACQEQNRRSKQGMTYSRY